MKDHWLKANSLISWYFQESIYKKLQKVLLLSLKSILFQITDESNVVRLKFDFLALQSFDLLSNNLGIFFAKL